MKAFLSHSSADKSFVVAVYDALRPESVWIDRAEIEWGDVFLERIEEGVKSSTDFVLFWSTSSAKSEWVRLEINMAFIRALNERAIRIRVVQLDATELPLRLKHFHCLSVARSSSPVEDLVASLKKVLSERPQGVRHRFLNRNSDLDRIEQMVNDAETCVILLQGFQGIGKTALANESVRRFFEGASAVEIAVTAGTGPTELALQLHHRAFNTVCPRMSGLEALAAIERSIIEIVRRGQFIIVRDCQHWIDGEQTIEEPMLTILRQAAGLSETVRRPIFLTSTRIPKIPVDMASYISTPRVAGLAKEHMASLVALWFELSEGRELDKRSAIQVVSKLHGHPISAKLAANLIGQYGLDHLMRYPAEMIALQRDLAKALIRDLKLNDPARELMEMLAIVGTGVSSTVLVDAMQMDEEPFLEAVANATAAGIVETDDSGHLVIHPLVSEYFLRSHMEHGEYRARAATAAPVVRELLSQTPVDSRALIGLLRAVFRLYILSGNLAEAQRLRGDLMGEMSSVAITHYRRRDYQLAEQLIEYVLAEDSTSWKMTQYLARIRVRQQRWGDADILIDKLLTERPGDTGSQHLRGWRLLREKRYKAAIEVFLKVLSQGDDVASLIPSRLDDCMSS